jgi:hypothetical protein
LSPTLLTDHDAERELLGDLILSAEAREACANLDERDLDGPGHAAVLRELREGQHASTSALAAAAGVPITRIADCVIASVTPMTAPWRARRLRELASRRRQLDIARQHARAVASDSDASELLHRLRQQIDAESGRLLRRVA